MAYVAGTTTAAAMATGWVARKVLKVSLNTPHTLEGGAKLAAAIAAGSALTTYLKQQKLLPM